jgi:hypothetical protein
VGWGDGHALLWEDSAESVVDLHPAGFDYSWAFATSGSQQVGSGDVTGGDWHALVWEGTPESVIDLHSFLPPGSMESEALGIDSSGNIVGFFDGGAILWIPALDTLELLDPNGGEVLVAGSTYSINWGSPESINTVLIEYSTDNGVNWAEVEPPNVGNSGSYNWTVPWVSSNQCLVQVSDASDPCTSDTSNDVFTIYVCEPLSSDLNDDYKVTLDDFGILEDDWLNIYIFEDLVNMASQWLNCGCSIQNACWEQP